MLKSLVVAFVATTFLIPNIQIKALPANSCTFVGSWFPSTATVDFPVAFTILASSSPSLLPRILLQAIKGTDNKLYTRIAGNTVIDSESNFSSWQEGAGITLKAEPEVVTFASTSGQIVVMAAYGTDNGLYTRTSDDGITWTNWVKGGTITIKGKPSLKEIQVYNFDTSAFEQRLIQTAYGTDNGLYTRRTLDGLNWTNWERAGSITIASPSEEHLNIDVSEANILLQYARGTDNGLYSRNTTDGVNWTAWARNSGGITVLDQPYTLRTIDTNQLGQPVIGKMLQFVRGTDKGIYIRSSVNALDWSSWERLGTLLAVNRPIATSTVNDTCGSKYANRVYVMGLDKKLYAVENSSSQSATFGFSEGLDWVADTSITLNNNISVIEYTSQFLPATPPSMSIQSAAGSDNKLYTRIISSTIDS